jgi:hypothetical protein
MKKEFRELLKEHGRSELPKVLLASAECAPLSTVFFRYKPRKK